MDNEAADAYRSASDQERRKLELLVSLGLHETAFSRKPLQDIIAEVSRNARQRGLTPEILQSILDSE